MRKAIFVIPAALAMALLGSSGHAHAGIGLGLEISVATGDFGDAAGGGGGVTIEYARPWNDNIEIGGGLGSIFLGGQEFIAAQQIGTINAGDVIFETSYFAVPITVQGRYFMKGLEEGGIYVGARIGLVPVTVELTTDIADLKSLEIDETESGFILVPEVGFRKGKFQANVSFSVTVQSRRDAP